MKCFDHWAPVCQKRELRALLFLPALLPIFPLECFCKIYRLAFPQKVAAIWEVTLRFRGNFSSQRKRGWHTPMGWHCCRVRMLILSSVITRCSDCSMIPALLFVSLSHPVQSEYLNSPNTGRFTVLTVDFALCLHKVMGVFTKFLAIVSFWDGKVSWSTHSLTGGRLL